MNSTLIVVIVAAVIVLLAVAIVLVVRRSARRSAMPSRVATAPTLRSRLSSARSALGGRLELAFSRSDLEPGFWTELEDALLSADVGVATTGDLVARVRGRRPASGEEARLALEAELIALLDRDDRRLRLTSHPAVILAVGVNGTGKTTTIAKLAALLDGSGKHVLLAAGDTFRAAAEDQLRVWGERIGVDVVSGGPGVDPAAVAFDAVKLAQSTGADVVIVDTAGRLHSKANLMDELGKVARVLRREAGAIDEVLLVIDGTTGQNAIAQARSFTEAVGVTGLVLTKLDGTARGGVVIAIEQELGLPVKLIGVGEGVSDLLPFEPRAFVEALVEP
jgi:fused signal recognition particle receptor